MILLLKILILFHTTVRNVTQTTTQYLSYVNKQLWQVSQELNHTILPYVQNIPKFSVQMEKKDETSRNKHAYFAPSIQICQRGGECCRELGGNQVLIFFSKQTCFSRALPDRQKHDSRTQAKKRKKREIQNKLIKNTDPV